MNKQELKRCKEFLDFFGVDYNNNPIILTDGGNSIIMNSKFGWKEFVGASINGVAKAVAKELKKECKYKSDYEMDTEYEISEYLKNKEPVTLHYNNETGEWQWAVSVNINPGFWLDAFKYKKDAISFCKKHGLKITQIIKDKKI